MCKISTVRDRSAIRIQDLSRGANDGEAVRVIAAIHMCILQWTRGDF